jgi:hypothetical protein
MSYFCVLTTFDILGYFLGALVILACTFFLAILAQGHPWSLMEERTDKREGVCMCVWTRACACVCVHACMCVYVGGWVCVFESLFNKPSYSWSKKKLFWT